MPAKHSTTELWSSSLLGDKRLGRNATEARKICNRWAEMSIFRFVLINCFLFVFIVYYYAMCS